MTLKQKWFWSAILVDSLITLNICLFAYEKYLTFADKSVLLLLQLFSLLFLLPAAALFWKEKTAVKNAETSAEEETAKSKKKSRTKKWLILLSSMAVAALFVLIPRLVPPVDPVSIAINVLNVLLLFGLLLFASMYRSW